MAKTATIRLDRQLRKLPLAAARPTGRVSRKGDSLFVPYLVQVKSHRHPDVQVNTIGIADCRLDGGLAVWIAGSWLPADSKGTTVAGKCTFWYPKAEVGRISWPAYMRETACIKSIYIAGPMSGLSHHNKPAFWLAERILNFGLLKVESPANYPATQSYAWYMREDLKKLLACEGVLFLKGWQQSKGASLEHQVAEITGKVMIYES